MVKTGVCHLNNFFINLSFTSGWLIVRVDQVDRNVIPGPNTIPQTYKNARQNVIECMEQTEYILKAWVPDIYS